MRTASNQASTMGGRMAFASPTTRPGSWARLSWTTKLSSTFSLHPCNSRTSRICPSSEGSFLSMAHSRQQQQQHWVTPAVDHTAATSCHAATHTWRKRATRSHSHNVHTFATPSSSTATLLSLQQQPAEPPEHRPSPLSGPLPGRASGQHSQTEAAAASSAAWPRNTVQVWWASPSDVPWLQLTSTYRSILPHSELKRVEEATSDELRQERLLTRVMGRTCLSVALGHAVAPEKLSFLTNTHGKPFLWLPGTSSDQHPSPSQPHTHYPTPSTSTNGHAAAHGSCSAPPKTTGRLLAQEPFSVNGSGSPASAPGSVTSSGREAVGTGGGGGAAGSGTEDGGGAAEELLMPRPLLQHNLTHTQGLVGCAVSHPLSPVGLDVEQIARHPQRLMALAKRRLSALEYEALSAVSSDEERAALFMRLWTLKEAFVKCRGVGINAAPGLKGFSIGIGPALQLDASALTHLCGIPLGQQAPHTLTLQLHAPMTYTSFTNPISTHISSDSHVDHRGRSGSSCDSGRGSMHAGVSGDDGGGLSPDRWTFMLFQPSPDHIAALCVQDPPAWTHPAANPSSQAATALSGNHLAGAGLSGGGGVHAAMWRTVPLLWQRPMSGGEGDSEGWPVLLGCSL